MPPIPLMTLPLHAIDTHPLLHLRQHEPVTPAGLETLAASMAGPEGLIHPLTVVALAQPSTFGRAYVLVAGHRRLAAAQHLGWQQIPVRVLPPADLDAPTTRLHLLAIALRENSERQALHPDDRRQALRLLQALYAEVYPPTAPRRDDALEQEPAPPSFTRWAASKTHLALSTVRRDLRQAALYADAGLLPGASTLEARLQQVLTLAQQLLTTLDACAPQLQATAVPGALRTPLQQTFQQLQARTTPLLAQVAARPEEVGDAPAP